MNYIIRILGAVVIALWFLSSGRTLFDFSKGDINFKSLALLLGLSVVWKFFCIEVLKL